MLAAFLLPNLAKTSSAWLQRRQQHASPVESVKVPVRCVSGNNEAGGSAGAVCPWLLQRTGFAVISEASVGGAMRRAQRCRLRPPSMALVHGPPAAFAIAILRPQSGRRFAIAERRANSESFERSGIDAFDSQCPCEIRSPP